MTPVQIKRHREALGLSPEQFAAKLGITHPESRSTVWRWEHGKSSPSPQTVMLMKLLRPSKRKNAR